LENIEKDEDRQTVRMIFQWLIEVVTSLAPGLQVIVTDLRILMKIGTKPVYGMKSGGGIVP